jgi:hypothetical protein
MVSLSNHWRGSHHACGVIGVTAIQTARRDFLRGYYIDLPIPFQVRSFVISYT